MKNWMKINFLAHFIFFQTHFSNRAVVKVVIHLNFHCGTIEWQKIIVSAGQFRTEWSTRDPDDTLYRQWIVVHSIKILIIFAQISFFIRCDKFASPLFSTLHFSIRAIATLFVTNSWINYGAFYLAFKLFLWQNKWEQKQMSVDKQAAVCTHYNEPVSLILY